MPSKTPLYRYLYPHRIVGLGLAALAVGTTLWVHGAPPAYWSVVAAMLVWPHAAYALARRGAHAFRAERRNLVIDTLIAGASLPLMAFCLLPSAVLVLVALFDRINLSIRRLWLDSLLGLAGSAVLVTALTRPTPRMETPLVVVVSCLPLLMLHMFLVSRGMNRYVRIVMRQNKKLEEAHRTDPQTRLHTRAHWMALATEALDTARAGGAPAALILIDVDHFKRINDTHSHLAGDAVIHAVGECIHKNLRPGDAAGRYGGDEFTVLCRNVSPQAVVEVAARLREAIGRIELTQWPALRIDSSLGVAGSGAHVALEDWIAQADAALYQAKRAGRGRVELASA